MSHHRPSLGSTDANASHAVSIARGHGNSAPATRTALPTAASTDRNVQSDKAATSIDPSLPSLAAEPPPAMIAPSPGDQPSSTANDDAVRHREKYEAFPVGARVEVWWSESGNPEDGGWWDAVVSYAGDVYEVEWIDDPGVFHRADYQAVRAPGSSPARGAAPKGRR